MVRKSQLIGLAVAAVLTGTCGSGAATPGSAVDGASLSATLHFGDGRETLTFRLHEPAGVILLYRVRALRGAVIRASAQLPGITVPLLIATPPVRLRSGCTAHASRITCTVGEEWCPMPEGIWMFSVEKLAGPAGDVTVWFRVGVPPGQRTT